MSEQLTPQTPINPTGAPSEQIMAQNSQNNEKEEKKDRKGLKTLVWILVILVVIILGLVLSAFIAGFSSVFEMINWIIAEVQATQ